jgi:homocysteine S-methyltransferase
VGCALNLNPPNPEEEINNLRRKLRAGADFILTQPIYEPSAAKAFLQRARESLAEYELRVLVGILPLASARHASFLQHEVPGIHIPENIHQRMAAAGDQAAKAGVEIGKELVEQICQFAQGIYLMPAFNRFDYAAQIVEFARSLG